jgi:hypothetical protein
MRSDADPYTTPITAAMDWDGQHTGADHRPGIMFSLGDVQQRDSSVPQAVSGTASGYSNRLKLSLDNALFPFLHPGGVGAFKTGDSLSTLLRQRMQQLFSPFTMVKEYLLVMFQVGIGSGRLCFNRVAAHGNSKQVICTNACMQTKNVYENRG